MDAQMGNTKDISASFLVSWWEQAVITNEVQILGQSILPACLSQYFGTTSYPQSGILSHSATAVNFQSTSATPDASTGPPTTIPLACRHCSLYCLAAMDALHKLHNIQL